MTKKLKEPVYVLRTCNKDLTSKGRVKYEPVWLTGEGKSRHAVVVDHGTWSAPINAYLDETLAAPMSEAEASLWRVVKAAICLNFGEDWNQGTHAKAHRQNLRDSVNAMPPAVRSFAEGFEANPSQGGRG